MLEAAHGAGQSQSLRRITALMSSHIVFGPFAANDLFPSLSHSHSGFCGPALIMRRRIGNRTRGSPVFACVIGAARRDD